MEMVTTKILTVTKWGKTGKKISLPIKIDVELGEDFYCFTDEGNIILKPYYNLTDFEKGQVSP